MAIRPQNQIVSDGLKAEQARILAEKGLDPVVLAREAAADRGETVGRIAAISIFGPVAFGGSMGALAGEQALTPLVGNPAGELIGNCIGALLGAAVGLALTPLMMPLIAIAQSVRMYQNAKSE